MTDLARDASAQRRLVLCADDYGLTPGIGVAIRQLMARRRLSATSCMTQSPYWRDEAKALDPALDADIGLHLTLTDQVPTTSSPLAPSGRLPSLWRLWGMLLADRAARRAADDELHRQLDRFVSAIGRWPDFIDGHQHVHLLPHVRNAVVEAAARIAQERPIYLRVCDDPVGQIVGRRVAVGKALFLAALSRPLRHLTTCAGIPTNDSFRGVSSFKSIHGFGHEFRRFLLGPGRRPLIMCHPGSIDHHLAKLDSVVDQRAREFDYLCDDELSDDLFRAEMKISRFAMPGGQERT